MPLYAYRRDDTGEIERVVMSFAEIDRRENDDGTIVLDDGVIGRRDFKAECQNTYRNTSEAWPYLSDALGVNPRQVEAAAKAAEEAGVPTNFHPDGRAELRTRGHRRRLMKALGMRDRDAGYGDG